MAEPPQESEPRLFSVPPQMIKAVLRDQLDQLITHAETCVRKRCRVCTRARKVRKALFAPFE